jgi:hypothetical protein
MTELKEKRKCRKFTQSETNMRNLMLKKLHESGDFDRCVVSLRGLNVVIYLYNNACYTSPHVSFLFNVVVVSNSVVIWVLCVWPTYTIFSLARGASDVDKQTFKNKHPLFQNKHNPII